MSKVRALKMLRDDDGEVTIIAALDTPEGRRKRAVKKAKSETVKQVIDSLERDGQP